MRKKRELKNDDELLRKMLTVRLNKTQNQFLLECVEFDDLRRGDVVRALIDSFIKQTPAKKVKRISRVSQIISKSMAALDQLNDQLYQVEKLSRRNNRAFLTELNKIKRLSHKPHFLK